MAFLRIVQSFELVLKSFESKSEKSFRSSFIGFGIYGAGAEGRAWQSIIKQLPERQLLE